jgi:hypothetical protein
MQAEVQIIELRIKYFFHVKFLSFFVSFLVLTPFYLLTAGVEVNVALHHTQ